MKRSVWLLILAVALGTLNAPVQAKSRREKERRGDRGAESGSPDEYAIMAKVLNLTDSEKADLAEVIKACAADATRQQKVRAYKLAELQKQLAEARKNKDKDAYGRIVEQFKALRTEEVEDRDDTMAAVTRLLTPEQKQRWAGFNVYRQIMPRFKRAQLTDEQDKKVRDMCNAKGTDILAKDAKARAEAYEALAAAITESVLTAEQKALMAGTADTGTPSRTERKADKGAAGDLRGEYAVMVRELNFTDDQKARLAQAIKAHADNAATRRKAYLDKVVELRKQMAQARKDNDKDAYSKVTEQYKALKAGSAQKRGVEIAAVNEILTPEQKQQWAGYTVYRRVVPRFKRVDLTEEQDKKIRDICNAKAKDVLAEDKKTRAEAHKALTAAIVESVLTAEQKEKVTGKKLKKDSRKDRKKKGGAPVATA